ncbi:MAG: glycosyltransferase [Gemmatimonadetes bacterium]|nr:glycosyltransferase [Gemmatimonadota bacterium]
MPTAPTSLRPLSAAVVNYNGAPYLEDTLEALFRWTPEGTEVLVVDSASTDGSAEWIEARFPEARMVRLARNKGPGAARTTALREAKHDRILLLDNDVAIQPDCVRMLSECLDSRPSAMAAFATMRYAHATDTVQFVAAEPHFLGTMALLGSALPAGDLPTDPFEVSTSPTSCMLVDRGRLPGLPDFDDGFFLYLEDHEWCLRMALEGKTLLADPRAHCLHGDGTVDVSIRQTGEFTALRLRHTVLNRWQILLKLYQTSTLVRFAPTLLLFEALQFGGAVKKGWLRHWLWALGALASSLPSLVRRRRAFQRRRIRDDLDVLVPGPFPYNPAMVSSRSEELARRALDRVAALNWRWAAKGVPSRPGNDSLASAPGGRNAAAVRS